MGVSGEETMGKGERGTYVVEDEVDRGNRVLWGSGELVTEEEGLLRW